MDRLCVRNKEIIIIIKGVLNTELTKPRILVKSASPLEILVFGRYWIRARTYLLFINTNEKGMVPSLYEGPKKGCKRLEMDCRHYWECCRDDGTACVCVKLIVCVQ